MARKERAYSAKAWVINRSGEKSRWKRRRLEAVTAVEREPTLMIMPIARAEDPNRSERWRGMKVV